MKKNLFPIFAVTLGGYYCGYAVLMGYAALFLQQKGFSNTSIGVFYSLSALLCIVLQGSVGRFLDNSQKFTAKHVLILLNIVSTVCVLILWTARIPVLILCAYTIAGSVLLAQNTFTASFAMEYINAGMEFNYSLARGMASFAFALITLIMGFVVERHSVYSIFACYLGIEVIFFFTLYSLPKLPYREKRSNGTIEKSSYRSFFQENPWILFLLVSILLVYTSYTSANYFQINIVQNVGGDSEAFGISSAIAAFVELPAAALFQPFSKKKGYRFVMCFACVFFFLKISTFFLARSIIQVYFAQCLQFASYGFFVPAGAYYFNSILKDKDKAKGQSLLGIFTFGLSGFISSLTSGIILDFFEVSTLLFFECILCLIGLLGIFFTFRYMSYKKKEG